MNADQVRVIINHTISVAGVVLSMLAIVGLSPEFAEKLAAAVKYIGDNAATISTAIGALSALGSTLYGIWKKSPNQALKSVEAIPGASVKIDPVVASPAVVQAAQDPARPEISLETKGVS